jgi:hypothetical protein
MVETDAAPSTQLPEDAMPNVVAANPSTKREQRSGTIAE